MILPWVAFALTLFGLWRIGRKDRLGFIAGVVGNVAWCAAYPHDPAILAMNIALAIVNVRGYDRWHKDDHDD